jgi:hypothetical protein
MCNVDLVKESVAYICPADNQPVDHAGKCPRCDANAKVVKTAVAEAAPTGGAEAKSVRGHERKLTMRRIGVLFGALIAVAVLAGAVLAAKKKAAETVWTSPDYATMGIDRIALIPS